MRYIILAVLASSFLGCSTIKEIASSTTVIKENQRAIKASTEGIERNKAVIENSSQVIAANSAVVAESSKAIAENRHQIVEATAIIEDNARHIRDATELLNLEWDSLAWVLAAIAALFWLPSLLICRRLKKMEKRLGTIFERLRNS